MAAGGRAGRLLGLLRPGLGLRLQHSLLLEHAAGQQAAAAPGLPRCLWQAARQRQRDRGQGWGWGRGFASGSYPPHTKLEMPALSPTMSQGNIAAWKKKEGEEIAAGDVLCEVETDKATMDWEAQDEGFLAKILVGDGAKDVPVGTLVAVVVEEEDQVGAFAEYSGDEEGGAPAPSGSSGGEAEKAGAPDEGQGGGEEEEEEEEEEEAGAGAAGGDYPPHQVMGLPALSPTMSQGNIAAWRKQVGDEVAAGDSLAEIETDKATMDWESQEDGYVAAILVPDGAKDVPAGSPVLVFVEDQEAVAAFKDYKLEDAEGAAKPKPKKEPKREPKQADKAPAPPKGEQKAAPPKKATKPAPSGGRVNASPYARKLAAQEGVDVGAATPSGPNQRIVAADVQRLIKEGGGKAAPAPAAAQEEAGAPPQGGEGEWTDEQHTNIRRVTAQRLSESKRTIPHYYLTADVQMDKVAELRAALNRGLEKDGQKLSVNDFIIKASALALRKVPDVNASWFPDFIRRYHNIDITVAVQTPAGLMVPILRDADFLGLTEISSGVKALAAKAKAGKLQPGEYTGGTFTVTNLGMFGVSQFSAIVNPPQACILAVGATQPRVVAVPGGGFREAAVMPVTLSCDHRVVDGALGALWLQAFRACLEDPNTMLL